jgi:hypothetical protein
MGIDDFIVEDAARPVFSDGDANFLHWSDFFKDHMERPFLDAGFFT